MKATNDQREALQKIAAEHYGFDDITELRTVDLVDVQDDILIAAKALPQHGDNKANMLVALNILERSVLVYKYIIGEVTL
jgi:hypothetical protein